MRIPALSLLSGAMIFLSACGSDKIDNSGIVNPGTGISYSADVQPIFTASCGGSGCHIGERTNGVNLTTHTEVTSSVGLQYGAIVVSGNAAGSPLVDKVSARPSQGSRMPLGRGALSASHIATIRAWIDDGAEDN